MFNIGFTCYAPSQVSVSLILNGHFLPTAFSKRGLKTHAGATREELLAEDEKCALQTQLMIVDDEHNQWQVTFHSQFEVLHGTAISR